MSLRAVKSPLAPKMTMEQGSARFRDSEAVADASAEFSVSGMARTWTRRRKNSIIVRGRIFARETTGPVARLFLLFKREDALLPGSDNLDANRVVANFQAANKDICFSDANFS